MVLQKRISSSWSSLSDSFVHSWLRNSKCKSDGIEEVESGGKATWPFKGLSLIPFVSVDLVATSTAALSNGRPLTLSATSSKQPTNYHLVLTSNFYRPLFGLARISHLVFLSWALSWDGRERVLELEAPPIRSSKLCWARFDRNTRSCCTTL